MFSIVIPLYNKAHTIISTLKSVLSQTYNNYEIIIVNDGSTDNGPKVIQSFSNDPRIRIVDQENQGISAARNRGIKESKFEHIAFLDGDDEWLPDFLSTVKDAIEMHPDAAMIGTSSIHKNIVTGEGVDVTVSKYRNQVAAVDCFKNDKLLPHTSAIVIKKSELKVLDKEYNAFPVGMKAFEDYACFHRIALTKKLIYIGSPLGIRNNNVAGQVTGVSEQEQIKLLPHVIRYYNLMYQFWTKSNKDNPHFIPFVEYNLRHRIKEFVQNDKRDSLDLLFKDLDKGYLNAFEKALYRSNKFKKLAVFYIYSTKVYSKVFNLIF